MVYIIGIGMDGAGTLTHEALSAIEKSDVLIGAERMLKPFSGYGRCILCSWKSGEIAEFLKHEDYNNAAVLMSGDCGFYSGAEKLLPQIDGLEVMVICGISSPAYFSSKIHKPWQKMNFVSLHGAEGNIVRNVCRSELCFFLLGGNADPAFICRRLCEYGMSGIRVYIGENLAGSGERIYTGTAADFTGLECGNLCVMVTENPAHEHGTAAGIPDCEFIRGSVPMTKSEVRCTAVSKLGVCAEDICWDVGCGTGSVSVEMALQCWAGRVYSIDRNEEAAALTDSNRRKFGCDNIEPVVGNAPECLAELPAPDRVFIGGSSGNITGVLSLVRQKNPAASVVVTAVSLETLNAAVDGFVQTGIQPEIVQIAVTRTRRVGSHTMLSAENPVFLIKGAAS